MLKASEDIFFQRKQKCTLILKSLLIFLFLVFVSVLRQGLSSFSCPRTGDTTQAGRHIDHRWD